MQFLLSLLPLLLSIFSPENSPEKELKTIQVYPEKVLTANFIGNGVQWSAYPHADAPDAEWGPLMTEEKWNMVFHRLDFMKPRMVRVMDQANWRYLKGFDRKGEPILDFQSPEVKSLEKLLGYCQQNNITVLFGEWGCPYQLKSTDPAGTPGFYGANDPRWTNIIIQYLDYLVNTRGYSCIRYYNLVNEPNGYWASTDGNWDQWAAGLKKMHHALDSAGFAGKISMAGPDVVAEYNHPNSRFTGPEWVIESAKQLDAFLGIYDIHAYTRYDFVRSGAFGKFYGKMARAALDVNKPIVFGEIGFDKSTPENQKRIKTDRQASEDSQMDVYDFSYGIDMADVSIQIMNAGYSGSLAWSLDDAMHTLGDAGDTTQLKRWGFWNSLGTEICHNPADENIRPWFYTWSLLCRYFPPGMDIVATDTTGIQGLRLVAGKQGNDLTVAIVNNSDVSQVFWLNPGEGVALRQYKKYQYSEAVRPVDAEGFPVPVEKFDSKKPLKRVEVKIPAKSFVLYTTLNL